MKKSLIITVGACLQWHFFSQLYLSFMLEIISVQLSIWGSKNTPGALKMHGKDS